MRSMDGVAHAFYWYGTKWHMTACYVVYGCMKSYKVAKEHSEAKGDHKPSKELKV